MVTCVVCMCVYFKLPISLSWNVSVTSEYSLVRQRESRHKKEKLEKDSEGKRSMKGTMNDKTDKTDFPTWTTCRKSETSSDWTEGTDTGMGWEIRLLYFALEKDIVNLKQSMTLLCENPASQPTLNRCGLTTADEDFLSHLFSTGNYEVMRATERVREKECFQINKDACICYMVCIWCD